MENRILTTIVLSAAVTLGGCGFKSDLFLPDSEVTDSLFARDAQPEMQTAEQIALELASPEDIVDSEEIKVDRVTTLASDAEILVGSSIEELVDAEISVDTADEGLVVDLTELEKSLEKKRNNQ